MVCQYQTVESTMTWRVAMTRERASSQSAQTTAPMPRKRWAAWVKVIR